MSCDQCAALQKHVEIRSPGEFRRALHIIRNHLADGSIIDFTAQAVTPSEAFNALTDQGPWPDFVEHYFRCATCDHHFRLAVDTYHGVGGQWEPYVARKV